MISWLKAIWFIVILFIVIWFFAFGHLTSFLMPNILGIFSNMRYDGSLSSVQFHVCNSVGGRRHTRGLQRKKRGNPLTTLYPSRQLQQKNNQPTTHTSHYPSQTEEKSFKKEKFSARGSVNFRSSFQVNNA